MQNTRNQSQAVVQHSDKSTRYRINPLEEIRIRVSSEDTNNAYCVIEHRGEVGSAPPLHLHRKADEVFEVIDGHIGFYLDGELIQARPGMTVAIPRNMPHTWRNLGTTQSRMVVTFIPGGTDRCFEAVEGISHQDPRAAQLAEKYDSIYLGPPVSAEMWANS